MILLETTNLILFCHARLHRLPRGRTVIPAGFTIRPGDGLATAHEPWPGASWAPLGQRLRQQWNSYPPFRACPPYAIAPSFWVSKGPCSSLALLVHSQGASLFWH